MSMGNDWDPRDQDFSRILDEDFQQKCAHDVAFMLHCEKCDALLSKDLKPICTACWNKRHPDEPANTGGVRDPQYFQTEECQDCGGLTTAGLTDVVKDG